MKEEGNGSPGHCGHHHNTTSGRKFWLSLGVTLFFCAGEAIAGLVSHSLALISDAGHNLSDALALGLAAYAMWAVRKPGSGRHTFGFHRVPILTALFNASTLVVIALFICIEAVHRFRQPESVNGTLMIWVALVALVMNTVIAAFLHGDAKHSLNSRAAFIHMAGDAISSLAVIFAGVVAHYTRWDYADPLASVLIAAFIFYSAVGIVKDAADILMEKAPKHLDLEALVESIKSIPPVCAVHHVHVWTVGESINLLSCHVALPASCTLEESGSIIDMINKRLHDDFAIGHATIQIETDGLCGPSECRLGAHVHEHEHDFEHQQ
ncbi:MAG: cation diffusion facilitator family transporter [Syntrophobacteraceae bacterium]|nr:cation diffusion facilitator family transporter [Syntrophobacteraceae bacterium]